MNFVCIGGGTGLFTLLSGLKQQFPADSLSAIVSMADDGGSTGRLRDEFGYLPPGDIRQSLVALSDAPQEMRALMQHRFKAGGSGLDGHVVGNILLTALKDIYKDEYAAIQAMERLFSIRGRVYPVTTMDCRLVARLENGDEIRGETNIDIPKHDASLRIEKLWLEPPGILFGPTAQQLESADVIIVGPGDLYTSILPNLVVDGMVDAIARARARGARILYVANVMTKRGETSGYRASDFINAVQEHGVTPHAIILNEGQLTAAQRDAYALEGAAPVEDDLGQSAREPTTAPWVIIRADIVHKDALARHNPQKLANAIARALLVLRSMPVRDSDDSPHADRP
jgi:uncharacterized cofD-like protein